jgi:hypothetical protein
VKPRQKKLLPAFFPAPMRWLWMLFPKLHRKLPSPNWNIPRFIVMDAVSRTVFVEFAKNLRRRTAVATCRDPHQTANTVQDEKIF